MNSILIKYTFTLFLFAFLFTGCELTPDAIDDENNDDPIVEKLYVKFENNSSSEYTITSIQLLNMGVAGTMDEPNGEFGTNILTTGTTIAPGEHEFFNLEIPNSHYAYYRLGVDDGNGNQIILHDQEGYTNSYEGPITHWGSDDRTVTVTIVKNSLGLISIRSWGDWAGIE